MNCPCNCYVVPSVLPVRGQLAILHHITLQNVVFSNVCNVWHKYISELPLLQEKDNRHADSERIDLGDRIVIMIFISTKKSHHDHSLSSVVVMLADYKEYIVAK